MQLAGKKPTQAGQQPPGSTLMYEDLQLMYMHQLLSGWEAKRWCTRLFRTN
jgi:hypothetical protein